MVMVVAAVRHLIKLSMLLDLCSSLRTRFTVHKLRLMVFHIYYVYLDGFCCWHLSRQKSFLQCTVLEPIST